jgi:nicotinate phosphoribosyltransferase
VAVEIGGGDHLEIARAAIAAFAKAGLEEPVLVASGNLDEFRISELRRTRTPLSAFIVAGLAIDDGTFRASYDMAAIEVDGQWTPRMTQGRSFTQSTDPGRKVVVRYSDANGHPLADVASATNERISSARDVRFIDRASGFPVRVQGAASSAPLLSNVMRAGKRVSAAEPSRAIRDRAVKAVRSLHERHRRLRSPATYPIGTTATVDALKRELLMRTKA